MKPSISPDLALDVARDLCDRADVELVLPGDPRREAIVYGLAATHTLSGDGWDVDHARQHVSVTVPGAGLSLELIRQIPTVGPIIADVAKGLKRPMIMLAPSALEGSGVRLLGITRHELGHVGQIRAGGLGWCLAYGVVPEARAGAEAPCYGADLAVGVRLGGEDIDTLEEACLRSLDNYGLDPQARTLAAGILRSVAASLHRGSDPGGIVADVEVALRARGWAG